MTKQYGQRWIKTEVKHAYKTSKAAEKGRLRALLEHEKNKPLTTEIREMLKKWLEKIDPIEAAAIIGGTIVTHEVIFKLAEFASTVKDFMENSIAAPALTWFNVFFFGPFAKPPYSDLGTGPAEISDDLMLWLVAFGISYYAVRHGADILGVAKMFFGKTTP
jgi:hypothetical protein